MAPCRIACTPHILGPMGRALMRRALIGQAIMGQALMGPHGPSLAPLSPDELGLNGPHGAILGQALIGRALIGPLCPQGQALIGLAPTSPPIVPNGLGPNGPSPNGPPWP